MMKTLIWTLLFLLVLSGCITTTGAYSTTAYTPISNTPVTDKADRIHVFFEGEKLNFKYTKIGLVEAVGGPYDSNTKLLNYLKKQAWNNGANGVIHIKRDYKTRSLEHSTLDTSYTETYSADVYRGIAVKIEIDSTFKANNNMTTDSTFISFAQQTGPSAKQAEASSNLAVGFLSCIGAVFYFLIESAIN